MAATQDSWFSCKGCIGSDPTQDTVKVNPALLKEMANKENAAPVQYQKKSSDQALMQQQQQQADDRRKQAEMDARRRKEEAAAEEKRQAQLADQEKERQAVETRKRQEEQRQKAAATAAAAAAAAAVVAEEERRRMEAHRAAMEQERLEREAAEAAEFEAAQEKVNQWCKSNGFPDMNSQKKTMRGATKFPLHTAVKHGNEEMVGLLLKCGANPDHTDSKKQTPGQLAEKLNKNSSDAARQNILAVLL